MRDNERKLEIIEGGKTNEKEICSFFYYCLSPVKPGRINLETPSEE